MAPNPLLKIYQDFLNKPQGRALLETIRRSEGTNGPNAYTTMFGGRQFGNMSRHPNQVVSSGGYVSAAAGAYQFMPDTWKEVATKLGLPDFSPTSQNIAALYKARQRLLPLGGLAALNKGLTPEIVDALAPEWASFPTKSGRSYYDQPVKPFSTLQKIFNDSLNPNNTTQVPSKTGQKISQDISDKVLNQITQGNNLAKTQMLAAALQDDGPNLAKNFLASYLNPSEDPEDLSSLLTGNLLSGLNIG